MSIKATIIDIFNIPNDSLLYLESHWSPQSSIVAHLLIWSQHCHCVTAATACSCFGVKTAL